MIQRNRTQPRIKLRLETFNLYILLNYILYLYDINQYIFDEAKNYLNCSFEMVKGGSQIRSNTRNDLCQRQEDAMSLSNHDMGPIHVTSIYRVVYFLIRNSKSTIYTRIYGFARHAEKERSKNKIEVQVFFFISLAYTTRTSSSCPLNMD